MTEHKLAWEEGVVGEEALLGEGEQCSTAVDRFSYSSGYKQEDMLAVVVLGDRGNRGSPSVPLVP